MTVRWAQFRPGATRPEVEREVDDQVCDCCMTASVLEPSGPRVVYRDKDADEIRDIASARPMAAGGQPRLDGRIAEDGWHIPACPVNGPSAARLSEQTAVAWFTAANQDPRVLFTRLGEDGHAVTAPDRLDTGRPVGRAAMVGLDGERVLVVWIEQNEGQASIVARIAGKNGLSEPHPLVDVTASRSSGFPVLARAGDQVLMAWTEVDAGQRKVRVARVELRGHN